MTPAQIKALPGLVSEIEASRDRAKAETTLQREIFRRARDLHLDGKALRKVIQRRAESAEAREQMEAVIGEYESALVPAKRAALEAIQHGASVKGAAKASGLPRGTLRHLVGGGEKLDSSPPHNPETGEIIESGPPESPVAAKAEAAGEGNTAAPEQEPAAGAAISNDAGGPPSAPTPAAGHIIDVTPLPAFLRRVRA